MKNSDILDVSDIGETPGNGDVVASVLSGDRTKKNAQQSPFTIEQWPIDRPIPYANNPRKLSAVAVDKVAASLEEFGWRQPIVVDCKGVVIAGHTRLLAAKQLELTKVPVHVATNLSAAQVKAYRLMDNRSHQESDWDLELLTAEMLELKELDLDLSLTGFESSELDKLLGPAEGLTPEDEVPPVPEAPVSQLGDLWLCGPHRVLCGDCTNSDSVKRLMGTEVARLCLTDPPYGVGEAYASYEDSPENLSELINGFLPLAQAYSQRALLTPGNKNQWLYPKPDWTLCWFVSAGTGRNPWGFSCWQPILAYGKCPYLASGAGSRPDAFSLTESADNSLGHPCSKPVKVWSWLMQRGSPEARDLVFDPFLGSGTSIIAAQMIDRRLYGLELEPCYCDVIVTRWQNYTGREATLEGDTRTFAAIAKARAKQEANTAA